MKKILRFRKPFIVVLCLVLLTVTAYAAGYTQTITVTYKDIKLVVDGVEVTPKDANGAEVEPFIYNGTTYLPIRAIGSALGKQVQWDGNTNTAYLGDNLGVSTFLMDVCPPYERSNAVPMTVTMSGQNYGHGFRILDTPGSYTYFNLNGNYRTMEFDFGAVDGYNEESASYEIYLDGQLVKTITHNPGEMVEHYTVSLNNALQMKIVGAGGDFAYCGFANITVQ